MRYEANNKAFFDNLKNLNTINLDSYTFLAIIVSINFLLERIHVLESYKEMHGY